MRYIWILSNQFFSQLYFLLACHPHSWVYTRTRGSNTQTHIFFSYPGIAADAREQRVQDGVVVVTMQQDEAQEGFQEGGLRHAAQEKV